MLSLQQLSSKILFVLTILMVLYTVVVGFLLPFAVFDALGSPEHLNLGGGGPYQDMGKYYGRDGKETSGPMSVRVSLIGLFLAGPCALFGFFVGFCLIYPFVEYGYRCNFSQSLIATTLFILFNALIIYDYRHSPSRAVVTIVGLITATAIIGNILCALFPPPKPLPDSPPVS